MRMSRISIFVACLIVAVASSSQSLASSHKRIPSGFTGVRGKKSIASNPIQFESKSASLPINLQEEEEEDNDEGSAGKIAKRASSAGFLGMRGKKPFEGWVNGDVGGPAGFFGMRGKKQRDEGGTGKRAPSSGFTGMRGKKRADDETDVDYVVANNDNDDDGNVYGGGLNLVDDKRAPFSHRFFDGMRGERKRGGGDSRAGFFGMRGKKFPYEFRGKFVGVRGKKTTYPSYPLYDAQRANPLDVNQMMLLLTESTDSAKQPGFLRDENELSSLIN